MRGVLRWGATWAASLAVAVSCARASETPVEYWDQIQRNQLSGRASFDFKDAPVQEAIAFLSSASKVVMAVEPDVLKDKPTVTLQAKDIPMRDALRQIVDKAGLDFQTLDLGVYVVKKGAQKDDPLPPFRPVVEWQRDLRQKLQRSVTYEFIDVPLDEAIAVLRAISRANVILDPALLRKGRPRANLQFADMTVEAVLMWLMRLEKLNYTLCDEAMFIHAQGAYSEQTPPTLTPAQSEALKQATQDLGAEDFDARERASKTIAELGQGAAAQLRAAMAKATDPETRLRLRSVLDGFSGPEFFAEPPDVEKALGGLNERTNCEFTEMALAESVAHFASLVKKPITADSVEGLTVTLRMLDMRIGNALRWTARVAGARIVMKGAALQFVRR